MKMPKLLVSALLSAVSFVVYQSVDAQSTGGTIGGTGVVMPKTHLASSIRYDSSTPTYDTPQSWSFMRYGNTPVDLYTGTAQANIPVYAYKDNDFNISVSTGFSSTGFRADQPTGIVGMNWSLIAGGIITQDVRGLGDFDIADTFDGMSVLGFLRYNTDTIVDFYSDKFLFESAGFGGLLQATISNIQPDPYDRMYRYLHIKGGMAASSDTEADVFNFNFMGHYGSFHYNYKKDLKVYNTNRNNGIYDVDLGENSIEDNITGPRRIIITTGDGYKYVFGRRIGENSGYDNFEIQINGYMQHRYARYSLNSGVNKPEKHTITSWMLSQIIAPNGREVRFYYDGKMPETEREPPVLIDDDPLLDTDYDLGHKPGYDSDGNWIDPRYILLGIGEERIIGKKPDLAGNIIVTEPQDIYARITDFDGDRGGFLPPIRNIFSIVIPNEFKERDNENGVKYWEDASDTRQDSLRYYPETILGSYHYYQVYDDEATKSNPQKDPVFIKIPGIPAYRLIPLRRRMNVIKSTYLTRIVVDERVVSGGVTINFDYSLKESREISDIQTVDTVNNPFARYVRLLKRLDRVYVTTGEDNKDTLSYTAFHYRKKPANDNGTFRTMLDSVSTRGLGTYRLSYYEPENGVFPDLSSWGDDFWGFYNGKDETTALPCAYNEYNDEIIPVSNNNPHSKEPDFNYSVVGNLKRITYPTGGYTEFKYEGHTASKGVFKINRTTPYNTTHFIGIDTMLLFRANLYDLEKNVPVGGIRIKQITDDNGVGSITTRTYDYNSNTLSNGTILQFPRYKYSERELLPFGNYYFRPNTIDKTHIEYSRVRETFNDGSSVEYHFSNYQTNPDDYEGQQHFEADRYNLTRYSVPLPMGYNSDNTFWVNTEKVNLLRIDPYIPFDVTNPNTKQGISQLYYNFNRVANSQHLERGKLIEKQYIDNNSRCVKKETYNYTRSSDDYTTAISISGNILAKYKTYVGDYRMVSSESTEYFYDDDEIDTPSVGGVIFAGGKRLTTKTTLSYNDRGQIVEIRSELPDSTIRVRNVEYYENTLGYYNLIKSIVDREITAQERLISSENMEYMSVSLSRNINFLLKPSKYRKIGFADPTLPVQTPVDTADITYTKYDSSYGRLLESKDRNGVNTSYVWDEYGMNVIAIVRGSTYSQVQSAIGFINDYTLTVQQEQMLRSLPSAEVTTLEYIPFVGVSKVTEPSGRVLRYEYTPTGKLERIIDGEGNIVNEYKYSVEL